MNKRQLEKKIFHYNERQENFHNSKRNLKDYLKLLNYTLIYQQKYGTMETRKCMIKNLTEHLNSFESIEICHLIIHCMIQMMILNQQHSTKSDEEKTQN